MLTFIPKREKGEIQMSKMFRKFRKMICLVSFVLVLGLTTTVAKADIADGLVGYWPLDEGAGTTTEDVSGNGSEGTVYGGPNWVDGKFGSALEFDGSDDYVDCGNPNILDFGTSDFTISAWVNSTNVGGETVVANGGDNSGGIRWRLRVFGTTPQIVLDDDVTKLDPPGSIDVTDGGWHHILALRRGTIIRVYVDAVEDPATTAHSESTIPADYDLSGTSQHNAYIGCLTLHDTGEIAKFFAGMIDDVAIWNRALTPEEIIYLWNDGVGNTVSVSEPGKASDPSLADGAEDVLRDVVLSWTPGEFAAPTNGHNVYLSESFDDVNDGVGAITQDANSYTPAQRLDFGTTYYWRVDEANSTTGWDEGDIWQFTTELLANPIDVNNITATASSTNQADQGPENTINGSGLDVNDMHSTLDTDMWLNGGEPNAWIEYELDKVHKLHEMWVWNSNQAMEPALGFGLKDVTIEYSTNGTDYTTLAGVPEFAQAPGASDYEHNTTVDFNGVTAKYVRLIANSKWGSFMPQSGLSEVRFFSIPVYAREPSPDSGATDVDVEATLSWRAGRDAAKHDVYLSTDEQAVIDGNVPNTTVAETSYSASLDVDSTYYWRVDEVNDAETTTTWRGEIWNFTTPEYLVVDDFESYNAIDPPDPASNTIFASWEDGYFTPTTNGALVGVGNLPYTETRAAYVHSGAQAMPYSYGNNGKSSVGTLTLTGTARDFTRHGVGQLSLWFRGESTNDVEPMYVTLNGIAIAHTNPNATQVDAYEEWVIPLQDFATLGVTLNNVTSIAISIGTPTPGAASGAGTMSFDDLRLYRIAP